MTSTNNKNGPRKNTLTLTVVLTVVAGMIALSFAAVPLYKVFCQTTGFGGTTQVSIKAPAADKILNRSVEIRFNADTGPKLNWDFRPDQRSLRVKLGQQGLATFSARNRDRHDVTAVAVYNVSPPKAGIYFHKIQCFCFGEQSLKGGEKVDYPVVFFVDPSLNKDPNMADVDTITLSYTFFQKDAPEIDAAIEGGGTTTAPPAQQSSPQDSNAFAGTVALPPEKQ